MYRNILVPIAFDHAERAQAAFDAAEALRTDDGHITLLHVMEEIPAYVDTLLPEGLHEHTAETALTRLREIAAPDRAHVSVAAVWGHAGRTILEVAAEKGCDCIVVASHRPGLEDYFLGSTAARVVRHANCAVHVLR